MEKMLEIKNLYASVAENYKEIIKNLNLSIKKGETHVIMGPNGAGKSTLANLIMGHPSYIINSGDIAFEGDSIIEEKTDERGRRGIFLSFQNSEEIDGLTVENFLRTAKSSITGKDISVYNFHNDLMKLMKKLDFDPDYASRYLNVGFSGGEKKKNEIFQMLALNPKFAILDETDSGLDVDAVKVVSKGISNFKTKENSILIITHNIRLLENIEYDYVHVLIDGHIVYTGDKNLAKEINDNGYKRFTDIPAARE